MEEVGGEGGRLMLEITEVSADDELEGLRTEWDDLVGRSNRAGVFQTWEWVTCCRRHFGGRRRLVLLCVRYGERLVGIAPLEIAPMYGLPLRRLQFIGTLISDYLDFILDPDAESPALEAIFSWIDGNRRRWDLLDLQQIPGDSVTIAWTSDDRPRIERIEQEVCPYLPLAESWDDTLNSFGKKTRFNLGYYERLARRDFDFSLGLLADDEITEGMDAFFRLHAQRWRRRWLPGVLAGDRIQAFHREVAHRFAKKGWLRLHGMRLNGRIRSVLYCFSHKDRAYYYLGGFDPALSRYSLGTVLTGHAIRHAVEEGCREFDFLRGNEPYKSRWTRERRTNHRLLSPGTGLRSRAASDVCRLERGIEHRAKSWLEKRLSKA